MVNVEIVTLNTFYPIVLGSMPYTGPAVDLAVEQLRVECKNVFNLSLVNLYDKNARSCEQTSDGAGDILGRYFNQRKTGADITGIIFSGTRWPG